MKKYILYIAAILMLCSSVARADDLKDTEDAYKKGNYAQVIELLLPLVAQGDAEAQFRLGWIYAEGKGVIQDYVRAHMWFNLAASSGNKYGSENRVKVAKKMTPSQISEAQDMAKDCTMKNYKNCE